MNTVKLCKPNVMLKVLYIDSLNYKIINIEVSPKAYYIVCSSILSPASISLVIYTK